MKAALLLFCLALFVALNNAAYVCNSTSNNMPDCTDASFQGLKIRNFWDPTRYWACNSTQAVAVPCEILHPNGTVTPQGFLASTAECVPWPEWSWSPYCP